MPWPKRGFSLAHQAHRARPSPSRIPTVIRLSGHFTLCQFMSCGRQRQISRLLPSRAECMYYSLGRAGLGHTSIDCVGQYTDLIGCVLVPVAVCRGVPWPASSSHRDKPSLEGLDLSHGTWGAHFYGNADGFRVIFGAAGRVWARALRPGPHKKVTLVRLVGCTTNTDFLSAVDPESFRTDTSTCCSNNLIL